MGYDTDENVLECGCIKIHKSHDSFNYSYNYFSSICEFHKKKNEENEKERKRFSTEKLEKEKLINDILDDIKKENIDFKKTPRKLFCEIVINDYYLKIDKFNLTKINKRYYFCENTYNKFVSICKEKQINLKQIKYVDVGNNIKRMDKIDI